MPVLAFTTSPLKSTACWFATNVACLPRTTNLLKKYAKIHFWKSWVCNYEWGAGHGWDLMQGSSRSMGATSCQSSTTLSYTIQTHLVLPGTSSTRSHFSCIARFQANWAPQSWSFAFVYWCSMSLHHSDQMSQGSGCFTNSLCLCLLVNGHWSGHVSSSLWSDVPGSW